MSIKRILFLALFFFSFCLFVPQTSKAVDLKEVLTSENSIITKIQEGVEYLFAFKTENKVQVLEKQAERRLIMAKGYADQGNNERVQNIMQSYLQIKEKQNDLLGKDDTKDVLGDVEERTIEQQKTMEEIKTKIDDNGKQGVVEVQEKVVNQVAQRVIEVKHVWAPGTGPGGEAGVVVVGGTMQFAPGTSAGGSAGSDIKTVEVKTGGGGSGGTNVVEGGSQNTAPAGGNVNTTTTNTIDPGGLAPGTTLEGKNELAP
jgi:hypothetical protein